MSIKIIQLGVGGFGHAWRHGITTTPDVEVVALVDVNPVALEEGAKFYNLPSDRCFAADDKKWEEVEADIVIDATPHLFHYENAMRVFGSGKNCIFVKPMSDAWDKGLAMVEESEKRGCKMAVAQQLRFHPLIMKVREIITGGVLGEPGYVHLDAFFGYPGLNRQTWTQPYPLLAECSIHHLDYLRWALGQDAVAVSAEHWNPSWVKKYGLRYAYCLFEMDKGCRVSYRAIATKGDTISWLCHWQVEGEKGILKVEKDRLYLNNEEIKVAWEDSRNISDLNLSGLNKIVLEQFIDYITEDREPSISGKNNLNSLHMVFGSVESAGKSKRVKLWTRR